MKGIFVCGTNIGPNIYLFLTNNVIGLAGAGFNHAWTTIKAFDPCVEAKQDDYIKGICSPGS